MTGSPLLLGVVGALQYLPVLLFSLHVGAMIDQWEKKRVVIFTQIMFTCIASALSILVLTHQIRYWHLLILSAAIGIVNAVDLSARQAFNIEMVGKRDLMNAIGLNSAVFNGARIVGPAIAGVIMAGLGIGYCFLINALSFIPLVAGLFFIKPAFSYMSEPADRNILRDISDGVNYMISEKNIFTTIITVFIVGTFILNFNVLVPVLAKTGLGLSEKGYGFLWSCMGIGSLTGALVIAVKSGQGPKNTVLSIYPSAVSLLFVLIGLNNNLFVSSMLLGAAGFITVAIMITANSSLQLQSKDEFRSRIISLYMLVNAGTTPVGNLIAGGLSNVFGIKTCFIIIGAGVFLLLAIQRCFILRSTKKAR